MTPAQTIAELCDQVLEPTCTASEGADLLAEAGAVASAEWRSSLPHDVFLTIAAANAVNLRRFPRSSVTAGWRLFFGFHEAAILLVDAERERRAS